MQARRFGGGLLTVSSLSAPVAFDKLIDGLPQWAYWLILAACIAMAIIGLIMVFRPSQPDREAEKMGNTFNNYGNAGQMGNITNNFGDVSLNLSDSDIEKLVKDTPRNLPVLIQYVGKPAGAHNMERLAAALRSVGLSVETQYLAMQMMPPPPTKLGINQRDGKTNILIAPEA
jgi:hypothetical protein